MKFIESMIMAISPRAAAQRAYYAMQAQRFYDAGKDSIYHRRPGQQGSGDQSLEKARERIRDYARYLDENLDLAIGILDELVNKVVGTGIVLEPRVLNNDGTLDEGMNRDITKSWTAWTKRPEVTAELSFNEVQRLAARTWFRDGEVLSQMVLGARPGLTHMGGVPFSIEMIECDFLPFGLTDRSAGIIHGVEKNEWGRPRAYHLLKQSPDTHLALIVIPSINDTNRVPASRMLHLKFTRRLNQTRGVSVFHGVAHRLDDIKDYEESERIAAKIGASFAGFIRKGTEFDFLGANSKAGVRELEIKAGTIFDDLLPGEDIGTIDTNRPNTNLQAFRNSQLRAIAAGTGTSYSTISKDFNGTFSAQRQELVESIPGYSRLRDHFVSAYLQPIYTNFINAGVLSSELRIPATVDRTTLLDADWIAPPSSWIDPKKEVEGDALAVDNGFISRAQVIRQRTGRDPIHVKEQIEIELQEETPKSQAVSKGTARGRRASDGTEAPDEDEDDDDNEAAAA